MKKIIYKKKGSNISLDWAEILADINLNNFDVEFGAFDVHFDGPLYLRPIRDAEHGEFFEKLIDLLQGQYFMTFWDLFLYPAGSKKDKLLTFADFEESNCIATLSCYDVHSLCVLAKEDELFETIHLNLERSKHKEWINEFEYKRESKMFDDMVLK